MANSLIINSEPSEVRVALLENGAPVEVFIERQAELGVVGNIYRGRVVRVLPGMQAAFVEIGLARTAFLYVNDAVLPAPGAKKPTDDSVLVDTQISVPPESSNATAEAAAGDTARGYRQAPIANIADVLKQGQEIVVQVQKEPLGTKGARLTRQVTVPGRYVVYMPYSDHIGVSHRIEDEKERERLRQILEGHAGVGAGFIVRTAAEGESEEVLVAEASLLMSLWKEIERRGCSGETPRMVHQDLDLVLRATRDLFTGKVDRIVVDDVEEKNRIHEFVASFSDEAASTVELYDGTEPLFDHFGIEIEIERALERRVWLKSGGYIVIDQAEALTVVDVNSGRYVGKSSLEDTITQINLEAVKEVAFQLRLRNLGGIIIIDFIDMSEASNREKVLGALGEALSHDKTKSAIVRMSSIGLVEMTRKRVRDSLGHTLTEQCPYCRARGHIKSKQTVANEILRAAARSLARFPSKQLLVNMQSGIANYLYANESARIERLEVQHGSLFIPVARRGFHRERYEIVNSSESPNGK